MSTELASAAPAPITAAAASEEASALELELGLIVALWRRDTIRLFRERARWIGLVLQPLMLWAILGTGFAETFRVSGFENVTSLQFLYPGILAMVLLFTSIFSTMSVIEDRQSGFLQGVLVSPGSPLALVLGKTLGVTTIVVLQVMLFLLAAPLAGYSFAAINYPALLAVILLSNTALTCANFVFAWILNSTHGYHALMSIVLMPMWMVSGAMFPAPGGWMGWVVTLNPMTYGVAGLRSALGLPVGVMPGLGTSLAVLSACTVVALFAAVSVTRRR